MKKSYFSGWKKISKEQALRWAQHIYNGVTTRASVGKVEYINARLEGVQFTESEIKQATRK